MVGVPLEGLIGDTGEGGISASFSTGGGSGSGSGAGAGGRAEVEATG